MSPEPKRASGTRQTLFLSGRGSGRPNQRMQVSERCGQWQWLRLGRPPPDPCCYPREISISKASIVAPDIDVIQRYIAYGSVGASTVRGLRTKGVVDAAREALRDLNLKPYGDGTAKSFRKTLDADTEDVRRALPSGARHWGVARKVLNIFLRGSLYNTYLTAHFGLARLDACYEIPLDSLSAMGIREHTNERPLPRWVGVKYVTPKINDHFQRLATEIAVEKNTLRVHLDALFWGGR